MSDSSVGEIEADIEETRSRLYGTIDRIQGRLTVTGIVDEVMGAAGVPRYQSGHDYVLGLLRRHPVPIMIAAAGIGWWMYRQRRRAEAFAAIPDAEYVEVPALNDGQARAYDPDLPVRHPLSPFPIDGARTLSSQA